MVGLGESLAALEVELRLYRSERKQKNADELPKEVKDNLKIITWL